MDSVLLPHRLNRTLLATPRRIAVAPTVYAPWTQQLAYSVATIPHVCGLASVQGLLQAAVPGLSLRQHMYVVCYWAMRADLWAQPGAASGCPWLQLPPPEGVHQQRSGQQKETSALLAPSPANQASPLKSPQSMATCQDIIEHCCKAWPISRGPQQFRSD